MHSSTYIHIVTAGPSRGGGVVVSENGGTSSLIGSHGRGGSGNESEAANDALRRPRQKLGLSASHRMVGGFGADDSDSLSDSNMVGSPIRDSEVESDCTGGGGGGGVARSGAGVTLSVHRKKGNERGSLRPSISTASALSDASGLSLMSEDGEADVEVETEVIHCSLGLLPCRRTNFLVP